MISSGTQSEAFSFLTGAPAKDFFTNQSAASVPRANPEDYSGRPKFKLKQFFPPSGQQCLDNLLSRHHIGWLIEAEQNQFDATAQSSVSRTFLRDKALDPL